MNEDVLNTSVRRFLKAVGVTSEREMRQIGKEPAVRKTLKEGRAAMLDAISAAAKDRH
jgi:hypothetical protein